MSTVPLLTLMLYRTFYCIELLPEMLTIENDFRLANYQFLRCDVALSYLVGSTECVFCHCTAVKVRHFKCFGNLHLKRKCKQPRNKTRRFERKIVSSLDFSAEVPSPVFYLRGNNYWIKKKIASSWGFPVEFHSIFSKE